MLTSMHLNVTSAQIEETSGGDAHAAAPRDPAAIKRVGGVGADSKILRFYKAERTLHWAIAIPFLVCFASALILVVVYNPDRTRPFRSIFSWLHRSSGVALIVLPSLATFRSRGDARIHFYNIKQAWTWMFDDVKWLALMGLAAVSSRIRLPEQGKFNAAEKLNFMVLMVTYPLYVLTGLLMWVTQYAVLAWLLHALMATMAIPLILGHMYMALIDPGGRRGLQGMISGFVDRQWAKHHYRRWYREHHEEEEAPPPETSGAELCPAMASAHDDESKPERLG